MALDVDAPSPPDMSGPQRLVEYEAIDMTDQEIVDDHRHEALAAVLTDGAWADAFDEWAAHASLDEEAFEHARDLGLLDEFDFWWDPVSEDVGYHAPTLPDEHRDEFADPDGIDVEFDQLGRVVSEVLENDHLYRDGERFGFFADDGPDEDSLDEEDGTDREG